MDYHRMYRDKKCSAQDAVRQIKDGAQVCADIAAAIPPALSAALIDAAKEDRCREIRLHTMLDLGQLADFDADAAGNLTPVSWFSGGVLRNAANAGTGDLMSNYYHDQPALYTEYIDVDCFMATVSPMDKHGYFSCGATASNSQSLIRKAKTILLEVNKNMPRALSGPQIHISQVTALVENDAPLPVMPPAKIDEISQKIGEAIAAEVPDGATIQLGIGAIPEAFGLALKDKKDLGIHTELFTDSMVELIECGAVTNEKKPIYRGKSVATLAFGSQRIYDYIDDNPAMLMLPVDEVNDPAVIAMHDHFISVNAALEVDFFGQVCAESVGTRHVSGSGGQVDYVRGAVRSKGGKSFIAFASTAKNDTISKIKPTLTEGAIVTTSKNDVDIIVTEYGAAHLRGKTLSERTKALIAIAHPAFREELTFEAKKRNILI